MSGRPAIRRFTAPARFEVPTLPLAHVARPELVAQLEGTVAPLVVIVGSIGAGKTALASAWARDRSSTTVWMTCDPTDADPLRFWSALTEAVQRVAPDAGLDALARLDEEGAESVDAAASLATDCAALPGGAVVVDDFHLCGTSPAVLAAFIRSLPAGVRLVLVSRRDPSFSLARLRMQGQVLEIRDEALGFGVPEARQLFGHLRIDVREADLARLCQLTEGWAVGLQLAALSMTGQDDAAAFVEAFAGTDRGIADFLVNEVLDQLPADVADFLMATSVLDSFDAPLCAAVTGRSDAGELLASLRAGHFFVTEVDDRNGWFRYHHLFRSFLRARLQSTSVERFRAAHAAASRALIERGDLLTAVEHAMVAEDLHSALDLIRHLAVSRLDIEDRAATLDTIRAWLRLHGPHFVATQPRVVVECCIWLEAVGAPDDVAVWLDRVEQSPALEADPNCAAVLAAARGLHAQQHGDPQTALDRIADALRLVEADGDIWVTQWASVSCPAHLLLDDTDAVRRDVAASRGVSAAVPVLDAVRMPGFLAWAAALDGELDEAERQATLGLEAADSLGLTRSNYGRVPSMLALAVVATERNQLDEAARLTTVALDAGEVARRRAVLLHCLLQHARLDHALGDLEAAHARLARARQLLPDAAPPVVSQIDRVEAALAIAAGNPRAAAMVESLPLTGHRVVLEAQLLLQQADARSAAAVLDHHRDLMGSRLLQVQHGLLEARALARTNRDRAMERLATAVRSAMSVGLRRLIVDAGTEVHGLIETLPGDTQLRAFADEALEAVHRRPVARRPASREPADALSEREYEVLRYLASRLTYSEMAAELFISVNTLKSHLKSVYRKLGVSARSEAVAEARRSGLL